MSDILTRIDHGVLEIQFNRPEKKNAITEQMYTQLTQAFVDARKDESISVIMLSGHKSCFTAGNDLADFLENPPNDDDSAVFKFLRTMADYPKPIIAAVGGVAVGIGTTLLLHCDMVYCGESARFQLPFVNLGLSPEFGSSYLLPLRVGHTKAAEWLLTGKEFDAFEAKQAGLVNEVYKDEQFFSAALHHGHALARLPQESVRISKRLMKQTYMAKTLQAMDEEGEIFRKRLEGDAFKAAVSQFFSKSTRNSS